MIEVFFVISGPRFKSLMSLVIHKKQGGHKGRDCLVECCRGILIQIKCNFFKTGIFYNAKSMHGIINVGAPIVGALNSYS
jgi:hypothetical protein